MTYTADIHPAKRTFLPADFQVSDWAHLEPYFKALVDRSIQTKEELETWLRDQSELEAVVNEDACWRQIKMTCDTANKNLEEAFNFYCLEIQPKIQPYTDVLNHKLLASPALASLDQALYFTYLRQVKKSIALFREENIPLQAEMAVLQQQYGQITGEMQVTINGNAYTLQQAAKFLESPDRAEREMVYKLIQERRLQDKEKLDALFDQLLANRNQQALHAGFSNYRDFRFQELGRFDYTPEDCERFHESVKEHVIPLVKKIYEKKKEKLGVTELKPWDIEAEPAGTKPLQPFTHADELLEKTIDCFDEMNPFFGDCLRKMSTLNRLDLDSRKGKAPGGYNCPLAETGAPFIFMNAAGQMHDVSTMVHEGGHAIHSFLAHKLPLTGFKEYPMEIAEVASMSMELFSMDHWQHFFDQPEDLQRARQHQLERVITIFPWIAIIDKYQHWLYAHPQHTHEQRTATWENLLTEFSDGIIDYSGLEAFRRNAWQRQLHLFEVPFYYIEYGIAQLGAIGLWQQYVKDPQTAITHYCKALQLGGTKTLPELYAAAGLRFDFSSETIKDLMKFVEDRC